jgi:hypothetical protein
MTAKQVVAFLSLYPEFVHCRGAHNVSIVLCGIFFDWPFFARYTQYSKHQVLQIFEAPNPRGCKRAQLSSGAHPKWVLPGSTHPPPSPPQSKLQRTDLVDMVVSNVLRDLPFSWNQPLKSADG